MNDPCIQCIERGRCEQEGIDICKKKDAFIRYKAKCKEIAENTRKLMEAAKEKANEQV